MPNFFSHRVFVEFEKEKKINKVCGFITQDVEVMENVNRRELWPNASEMSVPVLSLKAMLAVAEDLEHLMPP